MKRVPWYLLLIIAYFVYDDVWVEEEHFPVLHRVLTFAVCVLLMLFVLGQGNVVKGFACAAFARVATRGEQLKRVWKHKFGKQNT